MTETRNRRTLAECLINGGTKGITFRRSSLLGTKEGSEPKPILENYSYNLSYICRETEHSRDLLGNSCPPYISQVIMIVNFVYPIPPMDSCNKIPLASRLDDLEWFESDSTNDTYRDEELVRDGNSWRKNIPHS